MKTRYSLARVAALLVFVCFLSAQGGATPIQGASLSAADGPIRSGSPAWPGPAGVMVAEPSPCRECATLPEERAPGGTAALRATIDTALASGPVLLYFHAASCGYCRAQTPIVAELEEELANVLTVIRLDIAERPGDAETFGVSAVPTMVLISGQEEGAYLQETLRGLTGKAELLAVLRPLTQARAVGMDTMTVSAMAQPSARNEEDPCQSPGDAPPLEREEASQPTATLWSLTTALWHQITGQDTPEATLRAALRRARDVGSYRAEIDLNQTVTSMSVPSFGARAESAHFQIESAIAGPGRARFTIAPVRTSFVLASREPQEFLVVGSSIYRRVGERWLEEDSAPISVSLDGDALSLVSVARDVAWLDPLEGSHGRIRRLGFALYSDDVTRFMLVQQDQLTPENMVLARLQGPAIHGAGELWVGESGLPARLLLNLTWDKRDRDPYRVHLESTTDYSGYGLRFPPERFDPTASPETGAPIPELGRLRRSQAGMWLLVPHHSGSVVNSPGLAHSAITGEVSMPKKRYVVDLTDAERQQLLALTKKGKVSARQLNRAHILLLADEGATDEAIAKALHVGDTTVGRIRQRFVEGNLERALREDPRPGRAPMLDDKQEAFLIALACSAPPEGRKCWTMQLLADELVRLQRVTAISDETVRRVLKKRRSNPG